MSNASKIPDGGYVPTYGSNLMLDGFNFDTDYGDGTDAARKDPSLPQSQSGLSALPDGLLGREACGDDEETYLDSMVETGDELGLGHIGSLMIAPQPLIDLSWLEEAEQDPDRLPRSHNDAVLTGLVEAWGVNRRTDGVSLHPNNRPPPAPKSPHVSKLPGDQLRDMVASAMRRSSFGEPFENIVRDVATRLGDDMRHVHTDPRLQHLASSIRAVRAEHGIAGKVFLREQAFKGLLTGKWDQDIRKKCSSAHYWLTTPGSKLSSFQNYLGKKVVTAIPWAEALEVYRPILEANGRKVASGDPRKALVSALLQQDATRVRKEAGVPVTCPVDTVSTAQAWAVFASAPAPTQEVVTRPDNSLHVAQKQVARWVSSGLLNRDAAKGLLKSSLAPAELVKAGAAKIAASGKVVTYMGTGVGATIRQDAPTTRNAAWAKERESEFERAILARTQRVVAGYVKVGTLTQTEGSQILKSGLSPAEMLRVAETRAADPNRPVVIPKTAKRDYQGAKYTPHDPMTRDASWTDDERGRLKSLLEIPDRDAAWARARTAEYDQGDMDMAHQKVGEYVRTGALSPDEGARILTSGMNARDILHFAGVKAGVKDRAYTGAKYEANSLVEMPKRNATWGADQESKLAKLAMDRAHETIQGMVKAGTLTQRDASRILALDINPKQMVRLATARAQDPYAPKVAPKVESRVYAEKVYHAAATEKKAATYDNPRVVSQVVKWASVQMNEGAAGKDLDDLLRSKFASPVLEAASQPLVQLRRKHEGLAGHLYVDASAYASPSGTTGCDQGALVHRATPIKALLGMDRCGSCAFNTGGGCQKYGKTLVEKAPTPDPVRYQRETIRLANATDDERTANLFRDPNSSVNIYQASEFDLQNDALDDIEFDTMPDHDTLNNILYEGMNIPMED